LQNNIIKSVFNDSRDVIWAGATEGLYVYNQTEDTFSLFDNSNLIIDQIISIIEDRNQNLWISSTNSIFKIDSSRTTVRRYNSENGVHLNLFTTANNYKDSKDELYLGDHEGYYHFYPSSLKEDIHPPFLNFASLQIGGKEIHYGANAILKAPLYSIKELKLPYNKNSFSFGFTAIDYHSLGEKRVIYRLENYDNGWLQTGSDKRAYFYNIPVGRYTLRVRAVNSAGGWIEKILAITITPPWWQTWWAITIFAITLIGVILGYSYYRSYSLRKENRLLEEKVKNRTLQLQQSVENLKATQNQLIQSEKMASLGELTAGIAHEIQNPLNFVNNFSEVNKELVDELQNELKTGTIDEAIAILGSIKENGEKINFHGKRADAIVKGMLQHASKSMGQKELTDINKLAEEYLKLSYHGLRAKDKDFNATFNTAIDESVGKIHVVPQDLGRVLLNLYNNAFYSVNKKKKQLNGSFEPVVIVCTRKQNNKIIISIKDNGTGIPQKAIDKVFQPFFTTKPTGEGTGLGLSLSYDIVKAHGGELKVESTEGEGATFIIELPA
jgi:signal transduction histidine kinase